MRDLLVTIIIFGSIPFILARPHVGVLMWTWIGIMNPHRLTWSFAYSMPFAAIVGVATLGSLIFSKEPKRFPWTPTTVFLILFVLWMSVTTLFAIFPDSAWLKWEKVIKIQLVTFIALILMSNRERINQLVWVVTMSVAFFGIKGGVFTLLTGGQFMVLGPPGSFIAGNTEISLALTMAFPLLRYLQLKTENKWIRHGLTAAMILSGFAIVGSHSRGAFLAAAAMILFMWLKSRKKILLTVALLFVVPATLSFMPEKWFERMETIQNYEEDASAMGRINAWWFAYNIARDNPITGGGFQVFEPSLFRIYAPDPEDFHDAHSIYFQVLGEHGFIGLFLFLCLGWLAWRTGSWIIRYTKDRLEFAWAHDLASMVQVSLVGYIVGGAFLGLAYWDAYYMLIVILVLVQVEIKKALAKEPARSISKKSPYNFANQASKAEGVYRKA